MTWSQLLKPNCDSQMSVGLTVFDEKTMGPSAIGMRLSISHLANKYFINTV
jgi:hypothetical protein